MTSSSSSSTCKCVGDGGGSIGGMGECRGTGGNPGGCRHGGVCGVGACNGGDCDGAICLCTVGRTALVNIVVSCCSAARSSSGIGARGDAGDGWESMFVRSRAAATALSLEEGTGMTTWVGNHASVSAIRSARVVHTHTR